MIQGTMSNVGKSVLTAGLCRIFAQDGYKVAPFKSQNMALNSYVTKQGLEMGRAQVMQAEAANTEPDIAMNPVLLKPTNDIGSQVIVNGKPLQTMSAREYFAYKHQLIPVIMEAYQKLDKEYDIIVIEGAGSPAEINLKSEDIVNMGMAKMADAPVLLVGDIDRGGVFAQLAGTLLLLEEEERDRIKGLWINKFRGDKSILMPGIRLLKQYTEIPVIGITPYIPLQLEEEDSLTERFASFDQGGRLDIAVIKLPRISNYTDFLPWEQVDGISLRYVQRVDEWGDPDMICIPGSKNTMSDLKWLRESGFESLIKKAVANDRLIVGICGGFQILGETIHDPHHTEEGGSISGLGLIPIVTEFSEEKTLSRSSGKMIEGGVSVFGYEIHMGKTCRKEPLPFFLELKGESDNIKGEYHKDGVQYRNIYGTLSLIHI